MDKKYFLLIAAGALTALAAYTYFGRTTPPQVALVPPSVHVSADVKNATYYIDGEKITLRNGISTLGAAPRSASRIVTKYFGNEVRADLNGDGITDVAFLLTQDGGGSGTFFFVAALLSDKNGYAGSNAILLGDRIAPQSTQFEGNQIVVNFAERVPGQPMTSAPTESVSKYFNVRNDQLVEVR